MGGSRLAFVLACFLSLADQGFVAGASASSGAGVLGALLSCLLIFRLDGSGVGRGRFSIFWSKGA